MSRKDTGECIKSVSETMRRTETDVKDECGVRLQQAVITAEGREQLGTGRAVDPNVVLPGNDHHETIKPYPNYSA